MKYRRSLVALALVLALTAVAIVLCYLGIWIPGNPSRAAFPVRGIDVSHYQGKIHWDAVASSGVRFAYIKATEGGDYTDPGFQENWDRAATSGISRGAYHFYTLGTPGKIQAASFIHTVPVDPDALPPMIDLEFSGVNKSIDSVENFQRELRDFISAIAAHYGRQPVIYTTSDFRNNYLQGIACDRWWIRNIVFNPATFSSEKWLIWQYTGRGHLNGIDGFVDLNVFNGSSTDFDAFLKKKD